MKKLYLTIFGAMSLTGLLEAKNSLMFNNGTQNEIKIHVKAAHKNKSNETRHDEKTFNIFSR